jgi:hypothetical protein
MDAHSTGVRTCTLWQDPEQREVFARVMTLSASRKQEVEYEIRDGDGQPLAVIRRAAGSLLRLRRGRWSVRQLNHADRLPAAGCRGKTFWWFCWTPLFLLQITHVLMGGVSGLFPVASPRRTRLRSGRRVVLDYHGVNRDLEVKADGWDPRVTAALVVLLDTWDSLLSELVTRRPTSEATAAATLRTQR